MTPLRGIWGIRREVALPRYYRLTSRIMRGVSDVLGAVVGAVDLFMVYVSGRARADRLAGISAGMRDGLNRPCGVPAAAGPLRALDHQPRKGDPLPR